MKALEQEQRSLLRRHGLRFGQYTLFMPALLKPAPTRLRIVLWGLSKGMDEIPAPPQPGVVTMPAPEGVPNEFFQMAGYRKAGNRALRLDMLERLADLIRPLNAREGFEATGDMLSITGLTMEQFAELLDGLGYRSEKGERPKPRPVKPGEMAFALEDGTEVTLTAYGTEEAAPAEPAMESFYTFRILPRGRRQQGEGNQGRRPPRNRNAGGGGGQGKPAEAGAPPARNEGGGRRNGRAAEGGGEGGGQKRRQEGGGGRQRFDKKFGEGGGGKRGGPKRDQPKREFSASPPRQEKKIDPDSPFAILQQLKDRK